MSEQHSTTETAQERVLAGLNTEQREAVSALPGPTLVLAGAGSGKTRVLVHRIAWLQEVEDIPLHRVLAVTFTNKAAAEMKQRVSVLLADTDMARQRLWIGTFHSIAHRFLRLHWEQAGLQKDFRIIDSGDQLRLMRRVLKELNIGEKMLSDQQARSFVNRSKEQALRPDDVVLDGPHSQLQQQVYAHYERLCADSSLVDFAELLLRSLELFRDNADLIAHYRQRFQEILVDEFQDSNPLQYAWLRRLCNTENRLFVVGDEDQTIYGWRGARIENLIHFERDFHHAKTYRLEQNYRSTEVILQASNALVANNRGRLGKRLWTQSSGGERIVVYEARNEYAEGDFLVVTMQEWRTAGNALEEIAVLYRSHAQSRVLEGALRGAGVPYQMRGGQRFFEREEVKHALAYLLLLINPDDDAAFERIINIPPRGIGSRTWDMVLAQARTEQISLWRAAESVIAAQEVTARAQQALSGFLALLQGLREQCAGKRLSVQVQLVIDRSGIKQHYIRDPAVQSRIENLQELVNATQEIPLGEDEAGDFAQLAAFLTDVTLDSEGNALAPQGVQLMTLHTAKGLEFPLVFLVGMEDGLLPHSLSVGEPAKIEEERRLCYVGMTRAERTLYLSFAGQRYNKAQRPSRFLDELPEGLLVRKRTAGYSRASLALSSQSRAPSTSQTRRQPQQWPSPPPQGARFLPGQRVQHPTFGRGVIRACTGVGAQEKAQVHFAQHGEKCLLLTHAKLRLLSS